MKEEQKLYKRHTASELKALHGISDGKSQIIKDLESKLKERDAMIDLLQRQRQELVDKVNELSNSERDELMEGMAEHIGKKYHPSEWVGAMEKTKQLLTRYSNLKAK